MKEEAYIIEAKEDIREMVNTQMNELAEYAQEKCLDTDWVFEKFKNMFGYAISNYYQGE